MKNLKIHIGVLLTLASILPSLANNLFVKNLNLETGLSSNFDK
jgi:hypothetical protein